MVGNFATGLGQALLDCRTLASITCWVAAGRRPSAGRFRRPEPLAFSPDSLHTGSLDGAREKWGVLTTQEAHQ